MPKSISPPHHLTQTALAKEMGVTRRTVAEWDEKGLRDAAVVSEKPLRYDALQAWKWRWQNDKQSPLTAMKARKLEVEAQQKELDLAVARGELVSVESMGKVLDDVFGLVRSRLISFKGMLPPRVVGMDTPRDAAAVIAPEIDALLAEIRAAGKEYVRDAA